MYRWYDPSMGWKWNLLNVWGKLTCPFTRVFWWLIKSIQYSIFLWKDFDWDYLYILRLLQYKLKRTRKTILSNNLVCDTDEIASQIRYAEDLIQKEIDGDFCEDLYEAHEKKWGKIKCLHSPDDNDNRFYKLNITTENAVTPELRKMERAERRKIHDKYEEAKKKNLDELFNYMRNQIECWWE
jgi:hypothetical protein